jgi:hypothetical protein
MINEMNGVAVVHISFDLNSLSRVVLTLTGLRLVVRDIQFLPYDFFFPRTEKILNEPVCTEIVFTSKPSASY